MNQKENTKEITFETMLSVATSIEVFMKGTILSQWSRRYTVHVGVIRIVSLGIVLVFSIIDD